MKEEKIMVLNMLQEGRINVEEALKLLDSIQGHSWGFPETEKNIDEQLSKFSQSIDGLTKDLCSKMESVFKDIEPKIKKASKKVVEKTANAVDQVSKSLNETLDSLKKYEESCEKECNEDDKPEEPVNNEDNREN